MKGLVKISIVLFMLSSCGGTADNKAPELANAMCDCFSSFQNGLSENAKKLMKEVSTAAKPQEVMMAGMSKFTPEEAKTFGEQLKTIGDKNSTVYKCLQDFDKQHTNETTIDKKALTDKLLMEMQKSGGCYVGAAIVNLNPKK